ncbi:glycosyltransferase family 4 protein [Patescibacteria group bacterium]
MSKIVVCSPQLGMSPESNSGGEVHDREVIKALCNSGIKVIVVLPKNKKSLSHKNLKVFYLPIPFVWPPYLFNLFIIPYLFYIYKKHRFNVLRVHSPYFSGIGCLIFRLFYRQIPILTTYHHIEENKICYNIINNLLIKKWNYIISVSQFTKNEIVKHHQIKQNKIKVIYNGVSSKFRPQKKEKALIKKYDLSGKKVLVFFGGLKKRKNPEFILRVFSKLKTNNLKLLLCGDGPLKTKLVNKVKSMNLENKIVFTGFVHEKDKVKYMNLADIVLLPSYMEGFGMIAVESQACGIPTITSNKGAFLETNSKENLIKLNVEDWVKRVEEVLRDLDSEKEKTKKLRNVLLSRFSWVNSKSIYDKIEII